MGLNMLRPLTHYDHNLRIRLQNWLYYYFHFTGGESDATALRYPDLKLTYW